MAKNKQKIAVAVETLELRRLLSASLTDAGVLIVSGSSTASNNITVGLDATGTNVDVSVNSDPVQSFTASSVSALTIIGSSSSDTITISQANNPFNISTKIFGGGGGDSITGGNEDDFIAGSGGSDTINSGSGNDTVRGGAGADSISCGDGTDSIFGNQGPDTLVSGGGTTLLKGGKGADSLIAGAGSDTLAGGAGSNDLEGGPGQCLFIGGQGQNTIQGGTGADTVNGAGSGDELHPGAGGLTHDDGPPPNIPDAPVKNPPDNAPVATDVGTVTGTVTDSTGAVVSGATVSLASTAPSQGNFSCADQFTTTTDDTGSYTLVNVPAGAYVVFAGKKDVGFVNASVMVTTSTTSTLPLALQAVTAPSTGVGTISGNVTDSANAIAPGATVLLVQEFSGGDSQSGDTGPGGAPLKTSTDDLGNFSLANVPAGNYLLVVFKQGDGHAQTQVSITANQTTTQNVQIADAPPPIVNPATISGLVTDANGKPVANASVALVLAPAPSGGNAGSNGNSGGPGPSDGGQEIVAQTDDKGDYTLSNVPAGVYSIVATKPGSGIAHMDGITVAASATLTENLQLAIPKPPTIVIGTVTGTVTAPDGTTLVAGAQVSLVPADLAGAGAINFNPALIVQTDDKGEFILDNVPAGDYVLFAGKDGVGETRINITVTADPNMPLQVQLNPPASSGPQPPPAGPGNS